MKFERIDIKACSKNWNSFIAPNSTLVPNEFFIAHNPKLANIFEKVFNYRSEYYFLKVDDRIIGLLLGLRINEKYISIPIFTGAGIFTDNLELNPYIYKNLLPSLGIYEIRDIIKFPKYSYVKKSLCYSSLTNNQDLHWENLHQK